MSSFWNELKRRNVVRVALAYVLVAWVLLQIVDFALDVIGTAPDWILQILVVLAAVGLPAVLVFSWVYEMTPEGLKLEKDIDRSQSITSDTGQKLNYVIIGVLAVAVGFLSYRQFVAAPPVNTAAPEVETADEISEEALPRSIAVLPFEDYSENQDQDYFSKGIAEEVLNLLAKTDSLRVAARTSSFAFGGKETDIREIGDKLQVGTVLEGSVRKAGETIRITAQLINVEDGYHIWSETYDRDYADIFKIQDEIAGSIMDSLRIHLLGEEEQRMVSEVANVDAYSAYLIGRERMALRTKEDLEAARAQFEKAIELDPDYAPAHVQLAHAWLLSEQYWFGGEDFEQKDVDAIITPHIEKALELTPDSAEAIAVKGYHDLRRHRYEEAKQAFDRALQLNPNDATTYGWRAEIAHEESRFLDMLADKEKAYALDPMSLQTAADLAREYASFWRPQDAQRVIDRMFALHPDHPMAYTAAIINLGNHGRNGEAQLMLQKALAANPDNEQFKEWEAWGYIFLGMYDKAAEVGDDKVKFMVALSSGDFEEASRLLEEGMAGEDTDDDWYFYGRWLYEVDTGEGHMTQLRRFVDLQLGQFEEDGVPWQGRCNPFLIHDLRTIGEGERAEPMMDACREKVIARYKAKYLCPCSYQNVVYVSILEDQTEEAIERANMWLSNGGSDHSLHIDVLFDQLKDHPQYGDILARNAAQLERQREIYLAGSNGATGSLGAGSGG